MRYNAHDFAKGDVKMAERMNKSDIAMPCVSLWDMFMKAVRFFAYSFFYAYYFFACKAEERRALI